MKHFFSFCLILLCLTGASNASADQAYHDKENGFSVSFPDKWKVRNPEFVLVEAIRQKTPISFSVDMKEVPQLAMLNLHGVNPLDVITIDDIMNTKSGKMLASGETTLGGQTAIWFKYADKVTMTQQAELFVKAMQVFTIVENHVFIVSMVSVNVSAEAADEEFEKAQPLFRKIVESVSFDSTTPAVKKIKIPWALIIISILVYFVLIITVPVAIRHLLIKERVAVIPGLGLSVACFVLYTLLFMLLQKNPPYLFNALSAVVAYYVFRKK